MNGAEQATLDQWLADVRAEYWERAGQATEGEDTPGQPHVVFHLTGKRYAVDASLCKGVVRRSRIARLPGVPSYVLGVAGIRGEVVSATDPAVLLGVTDERTETEGYFLILACGQIKTALWVDRVADVVLVGEDDVLPVEGLAPGAPEGLLTGQWPEGTAPVLILDGRRYLEVSAVGAPTSEAGIPTRNTEIPRVDL
jgi:purine-binding chemotaxis protein CheW